MKFTPDAKAEQLDAFATEAKRQYKQANYAPGLFTMDGSGKCQLDAYNSDGSANSSRNPAAAGLIVTVLITGAGAMQSLIADGAIGPMDPPYPAPLAPVFISVNGVPTPTVFVGQAPGKIAVVVRVDFAIPAGTSSGDAIIRVGMGATPIANTPQPTTTSRGLLRSQVVVVKDVSGPVSSPERDERS